MRTSSILAFLPLLLSVSCASVAPTPRGPLDLSGEITATTVADTAHRAELPVASTGRADPWIGSSYTMVKVGPFYGQGDLSALDTGIWGEVVFGRELTSFFALEGVVGYVEASCSSSCGGELWGIPVMAQARFSIPVAIFEPYAGVGVGGMYVDTKASDGVSTSDFVLAGDAFVGASVGLGNLAVGVEGKYLVTDEVDSQFTVEGMSGTLFVSMPF